MDDLKISKHGNVFVAVPTVSDLNIFPDFPTIILNIEKVELNISAGLQDRVIQTYGGLVHMDFSNPDRNLYTELDLSLLPKLYLVYNVGQGISFLNAFYFYLIISSS